MLENNKKRFSHYVDVEKEWIDKILNNKIALDNHRSPSSKWEFDIAGLCKDNDIATLLSHFLNGVMVSKDNEICLHDNIALYAFRRQMVAFWKKEQKNNHQFSNANGVLVPLSLQFERQA